MDKKKIDFFFCIVDTNARFSILGSYLFSYVFNRSYVIMFSINATLLLLAIIYTSVHLKVTYIDVLIYLTYFYRNENYQWKTTPKQRPISEVGICGMLPDFFDKDHVVQSAKTMLRKRSMNRRAYLWMLMVAMLFYTFQRDEKPMTYLYTQYKFHWNTEIYSAFKTFQSTAYVVLMLGGIPLMSKVFGLQDTVIKNIQIYCTLIPIFLLDQIVSRSKCRKIYVGTIPSNI